MPRPKGRTNPAKAKTKLHTTSFQLDPDQFARLTARAEAEGRYTGDLIRSAIDLYLTRPPVTATAQEPISPPEPRTTLQIPELAISTPDARVRELPPPDPEPDPSDDMVAAVRALVDAKLQQLDEAIDPEAVSGLQI